MYKRTQIFIRSLMNDNMNTMFDRLNQAILSYSGDHPESDPGIKGALANYANSLRAKNDFEDYMEELEADEG